MLNSVGRVLTERGEYWKWGRERGRGRERVRGEVFFFLFVYHQLLCNYMGFEMRDLSSNHTLDSCYVRENRPTGLKIFSNKIPTKI